MRRVFPLLLCCLLLWGCSHDPMPRQESALLPDLPAPVVSDLPEDDHEAVLWFRFGAEPCLAPEVRDLRVAANESVPLRLLQALLEGPSAGASELTDVFPQSTRVISTVQSGRVMFVTLSRHIMNGYADEPAAWRDDPRWHVEVPLRRQLAMQAIAATLTENCQVDSVIILVDQSATDSLRLRRSYYTLDGDTALADPLTRDEDFLLTPARTAEIILQAWQESDWTRLYRYLAATDPATGLSRPSEEDFAAMMSSGKHLLYAAAQGGSIHGSSALFTISGAVLDNGSQHPFAGMPLRLTLERGLWRVGLSQIHAREGLQ